MKQHRRRKPAFLLCAIGLVVGLLTAPSAMANHNVLVEGNCNNGTDPAFSPVPAPGVCGDYDGDQAIGTTEDNDGDRVFGTINGANTTGSAATRANNNGKITVVTSGLFAETVTLTGNVTLEAAPGVEANVDAVRQGDAGSNARQAAPGIIVDAPNNRYVVIRNLTSRNWTSGIQVLNNSRVAIEDVRVENNVNYGVEVSDNARVSINNSQVHATGFRLNPATGDFPTTSNPNPGIGIEFDDKSSGTVCQTSVTGSFRAGIRGSDKRVSTALLNVFDNKPDLSGLGKPGTSCIGDRRYDDRH